MAKTINADAFPRPITCLFPMLRFAVDNKVSVRKLLKGSNLKARSFLDLQRLVSVEQELLVTRNLTALQNDSTLSLKLGRYYGLDAQGLIGQLMRSSGGLKETLSALDSFSSLTNSLFNIRVQEKRDGYRVYMEPKTNLGDLQGFLLERDMSAGAMWIQDVFSVHQREMVVKLGMAHSPKCALADYGHYLVPDIQFGASANYADLSRKPVNRTSESGLENNHLLYRQCQTEMLIRGEVGQTLADQIKHYLRISDTSPDQLQVSEHFHLNERTLRRKLATEGTSFREIINESRRQQSSELLTASTLSIEDIAEQLGYSEASAFIHVFRRWFGKTPAQFRRANK